MQPTRKNKVGSLSIYERESVTKIVHYKEEVEQYCPTNLLLYQDFLVYISMGNYVYNTCLTMKASVRIFLTWNLKFNNNTTFYSLKKIHFSRFFDYCLNDCGYTFNRVNIIKSNLSILSDFAENVLGLYEFMPNARGDGNKWYRFTNIVKYVELKDTRDVIRPCNVEEFTEFELERLEWFLNETSNYEAIVVLKFCERGLGLLDLTLDEVKALNDKMCNKWVRFIENYHLPFNNAIVIQSDRKVWRTATKYDLKKYEDLFSTILGRKFIIC